MAFYSVDLWTLAMHMITERNLLKLFHFDLSVVRVNIRTAVHPARARARARGSHDVVERAAEWNNHIFCEAYKRAGI